MNVAQPNQSKSFPSQRIWRAIAVVAAVLLALTHAPTRARADSASSYQSGEVIEYSTYAAGEELTDSYYYSDEWFLKDPSERNDELALASMQLVAAAVTEDASGHGGTFLRDLGFDAVGFVGSDASVPDDCNYTWGTKTIQDGGESYTLVAIAVQSYSFDKEAKMKGWRQNFTVNGRDEQSAQGEHFAFAQAADKAIDGIAALAGSGKTKFWICGQSRGGAIASLIAKRLQDRLGGQNADIYAYTFESPAVIDAASAPDASAYSSIHNYLCSDDLVTKVPLWGMTRYGNTYELKTDETDAGLQRELSNLGSAAADFDVPDVEERVTDIISSLEALVPSRADYSRARTDTFTDADDGQVTINYSYQTTLTNLMALVFGGELEGLDTDALTDEIGELEPAVNALTEAVTKEKEQQDAVAMPSYWTAAKGLHAFIDSKAPAGPVSLSDSDFYVLLHLIGPIGVDTEYESVGNASTDIMGRLYPLLNIAINAGSMTYSHQFDTVIARLKTLAPQPAMDDIHIPISDPQAGDDAAKAPSEVVSYIEGLGGSWLTAQASWAESDQTLQNDQVYSLDVTLRVVGRSIPDDLNLTINGESPARKPTVTHEGNASIIRASWEYPIGNPAELTVTFDPNGHGETPEPLNVKAGTSLKNVETPDVATTVKDDGVTWRFDGWRDANGTPWNDLKVMQDTMVYAKWIRVVDDIRLTYTTPHVGDAAIAPKAPDDAPYIVSDFYTSDSNWDTVESIDGAGDYSLHFAIELKDPENSEFATAVDEYGMNDYAGILTLNDKELSPIYDEVYNAVEGNYDFVVSSEASPDEPAAPEEPETSEEPETPTYRVIRGNHQTWTKGSRSGATFVFKRSLDDKETFGRFTGISIDGETVPANRYTAEAGSVAVTLKPIYLETLATGRHKITAEFDDGSATAVFKVRQAKSSDRKRSGTDNHAAAATSRRDTTLPKTGDESATNLALALASIATAMLSAGMLLRQKE